MSRDPEGTRLPVKIDSTSNGEYMPIALDEVQAEANRVALDVARNQSRRLGMDRRGFLISAAGAASTLLAFNKVNAAAGRDGGSYLLPEEAADDIELAESVLNGDEFILDVQGHFVNPTGAWLKHDPNFMDGLSTTPKAQCAKAPNSGNRSYLHCLDENEFIKDVFLDSDTDMAVLSFLPSTRELEPLTIEEAAATREIIARLDGNQRLLLHGRVNPNQDGDIQAMDELAERWGVSAWKTYTQWGPNNVGYFLTDDVGVAMVEKARSLGVRNICVHKGIPFLGEISIEYSRCDDIGPIAKRFPDVNFLVYHSGFVPGRAEGPYDPNDNEGINSLIRSVQAAGIGPGGNVYAELGTTWRYLMRDPNSAAHAMGKLLKYFGPDNILWGTDSLWYGSPQDQIQAFRAFHISEKLCERHGYPQLDDDARRRIFGLNGAKVYGLSPDEVVRKQLTDTVRLQKDNYRNDPDPSFRTYGPKNRREFLNLMRWSV